MAVRGCLTLLFILLSGIVHADNMVTSPPSTAELKTTKLSSVVQTTLSVPSSTSVYSSATTSASTTPKSNTETTSNPTTTKSTTEAKVTTSTPTTTESTTETKITTSAPTTTKSTTATTVTTLAPTTTHQNTTNSTTETTVTTFAPTTSHNTTNVTTEVPTTTHTNPTTVPTTQVPNPTVGNYSVKSDNSSICLLANMGLQFSFKISGNASLQVVDLDPSPDVTTASGTCGSGGSDSSLLLTSKNITVHFFFSNVSQKFRLHALTLSVVLGNGKTFNESNANLSLWEASVGSSYLCKKEQSYNISDTLTLNTFELQVQPFDVKKNMFSTAEDCKADEPDNFIVPIAVGVALAVLVVIVLLAYLIGRKRSQTSAEECFLDSDLSFLVPIAVGVALSFLIILVLISYLIGRRKSRTGYQSV